MISAPFFSVITKVMVGFLATSSLANSSQYFAPVSPVTLSTTTFVPSAILPTPLVSPSPRSVIVTELNSPTAVPSGVCKKNKPRMANPPMRWLTARNFSAANIRSANWVLKKRANSAPRLNAPKTNPFIHHSVNFKPGMYEKPISNQAPQMKNCRNIMMLSLNIRPLGGGAAEPAEAPDETTAGGAAMQQHSERKLKSMRRM